MRLNELRGISLDNTFKGTVDNEKLNAEFLRNGFTTYGYILLESQPAQDTHCRIDGVKIERKPLKSRKSISYNDGRLIPIFDKVAFNILAKRYNEQGEFYKKLIWGLDKKNYLLFENVTKNFLAKKLHEAYEQTTFRYKPPHCLRHTRATYLAGETQSYILASLLLGHKKMETTDRYIHLHGDIIRKQKASAGANGLQMDFA